MKQLLFVSPVVPALAGSGVAMRAGCMIEALARKHEVSLLVVPLIAGSDEQIDRRIAKYCAEVKTVSLRNADPEFERIERIADPASRLASLALYPKPVLFRLATPENIQRAADAYKGRSFDTAHVFRLYAAPFAEPFLGKNAESWLDLDEVESETQKQLAAAHTRLGNDAEASLAKTEALKYAREERTWLPKFNRIFVASQKDCTVVTSLHPAANVSVVPNAIRLPQIPPTRTEQNEITLLFVGSMSYAPNEDAAIQFCCEILPQIRARVSTKVRASLVGNNPTERVQALADHPSVAVTGRVPDLTEYYTRATVVVVPLRAGGGTRIKILEAFAHQRPVVSTSKGAEGLEVQNRKHLLIADSPTDFAEACARLSADAKLRDTLVTKALEWVSSHHTVEAVTRCLP